MHTYIISHIQMFQSFLFYKHFHCCTILFLNALMSYIELKKLPCTKLSFCVPNQNPIRIERRLLGSAIIGYLTIYHKDKCINNFNSTHSYFHVKIVWWCFVDTTNPYYHLKYYKDLKGITRVATHSLHRYARMFGAC